MSSITFHTRDEDVSVGGAERAYMGFLCDRLTFAVLDIELASINSNEMRSRLMRVVRPGHYLHDMTPDKQVLSLPAALSCGHDTLQWNGHHIDFWHVVLNTALALGSDAVRLSARIHASCEIHGWVAGQNRLWLADIIEGGLTDDVLRQAHQTQYGNWPAVLKLLRSSTQSAVVMSYSVTDDFPPWDHENDCPKDWGTAFLELMASGGGLELCPDTWSTHRYGTGLTALDLTAPDWSARLDELYPKENP